MVRACVIVGILACMAAAPSPMAVIVALSGVILVASWPPWDRLARVRSAPRPAFVRMAWNWRAVVVLSFVGILGVGLFPKLNRPRVEDSHGGTNCKNNLKQLGLGLILYRDNQGRGARYPAHDGDDFLIAVWDAGVTQEPDLFLCPSSGDDNAEGAGLRLGGAAADACSYAGRRNRVQERYPGLFSNTDTSETAVASDDLEGTALFNHEDSVIVLFADGHVEQITTKDPAIVTTGFGNGGLLDPLAN